jgi:hypothetical protein
MDIDGGGGSRGGGTLRDSWIETGGSGAAGGRSKSDAALITSGKKGCATSTLVAVAGAVIVVLVVVLVPVLVLVVFKSHSSSDNPVNPIPNTIEPILPANWAATGVRQDVNGNVIITGGTGPPTLIGNTTAFIYHGALAGVPDNADSPSLYLFYPYFFNETVIASAFYGPNSPYYDSRLGNRNFTAVGAYSFKESQYQGSFQYVGAKNGTGVYKKIYIPPRVINGTTDGIGHTVAHSIMGNFVVGNYYLQSSEGRCHGYLWNTITEELQTIDRGLYSTTLYGIWQNGAYNSTKYTIAGGYSDTLSDGKAFIENYDSRTNTFSQFTSFSYGGDASYETHFDGISGNVNSGYSLAATQTSSTGVVSSSYAFVPLNSDGSFGNATWQIMLNDINGYLTTADTVIDYSVLGVFPTALPNASSSSVTDNPFSSYICPVTLS